MQKRYLNKDITTDIFRYNIMSNNNYIFIIKILVLLFVLWFIFLIVCS
jgi:hypothetical protein